MDRELELEDFAVGQTFKSGAVTVDEERIRTFAEEFDPQPMHTDPSAARQSLFGGLAASGWHTAAITMRLLVTSEMRVRGGLIGVGVDDLRWPMPVRPGDTLRVESEVVEVRPSKSDPTRGLVHFRVRTFNGEGQVVQQMIAKTIVPRRPA
jgi:acyl dehydratase